jgi:amiloride-sensitive sodium channel subunit beta
VGAKMSEYDFYAKRYISLVNVKNLNDTIQKKFGKKLDYILIICIFNFDECNLTQDFEYYYDFWYGNCFRYNSGRNMNGENTPRKQISVNGISNGFELELFIGRVDQNNYIFSIDNGINLFIENEIVGSESTDGIRISPGTKNYISLSKYSMSHFPKPYSDCTADLDKLESSDNIYFRNLIANNIKYRKSLCRFNCFQKHLYVFNNC